MASELRVVVDTNVLVSALLLPRSIPRQAFDLVLGKGQLLVSVATIAEYHNVLVRPKFNRYLPETLRLEFLAALVRDAELIEVSQDVRDCRDVKDNQFLEVAICGAASHLLTGDSDLLDLHPYRGIRILNPQAILDERRLGNEESDADFVLHFPFYTIETRARDILVVEWHGKPYVLGYATRELAELYLQEANDESLLVAELPDSEATKLFVRSVWTTTRKLLWNARLGPVQFREIELSQFLTP